MNGNIPDFVQQIQEVERNMKACWQVTQDDWKDQSAQSFDEHIMQPYLKVFESYITGEGIKGLGVEELMQHMDKHLRDMEEISGVSQNVQFAFAAGCQHNGKLNNWNDDEIDVEESDLVKGRNGVVHDDNRNRDYWKEDTNGTKPGELKDKDILEIFKEKQYGI